MNLKIEYIQNLYTSGSLNFYLESIIFIAIVQYQFEKDKDDIYISENAALEHIEKTKIAPFLNIEYCLTNISMLIQNEKKDLYKQNLLRKKQQYFKSLIKFKKDYNEIYNLFMRINWYVFEIDSYVNWKSFIDKLTENKDREIKNTRPLSGLKPYKVSSKIIYSRNGRK